MWKTHVSRSKLNVQAVAPVTEKRAKRDGKWFYFFSRNKISEGMCLFAFFKKIEQLSGFFRKDIVYCISVVSENEYPGKPRWSAKNHQSKEIFCLSRCVSGSVFP